MKQIEIEQMLQQAAAWVGYLEKGLQCYDYYESMTHGAGRANWTRFGRLADIVISGKDRRNKDGYSWCCMFILAVLYEMKAGRQNCRAAVGSMPVDEQARRWVADIVAGGGSLQYFAGCAAWYQSARQRGRVVRKPAPGDFVLYLDSVGKPYHIGIVEAVYSDYFVTIEGNTSANGENVEPNGGAVARKKRKKNVNCVFIQNNFVFLRK